MVSICKSDFHIRCRTGMNKFLLSRRCPSCITYDCAYESSKVAVVKCVKPYKRDREDFLTWDKVPNKDKRIQIK